MNILVCIPCLLTGGTEIQTLSLVEALAAAGHRVTTVCYFEHTVNMVARYEKAGSRVVLLAPNGERPAGVKATVAHLYKGLKQVVKEVRPEVAHVQYMAPGAIPIVLLRVLGVKKIVATAHTAADIYPSLRMVHFLVKHLLVAFQCITLRAEQSFFGNGLLFTKDLPLKKKGNHFTIYNTLPSYMELRKELRCFENELVTIGVVSRLERIKGMDLVVPAFAKVHEAYPQTRLLVVGDGGQRVLMERQVADAGVDGAVLFVGRQPQNALQGYYDQMDILLMPSRSEGFGLTAIEGMARGCVVVASEVGGLPEVVVPGCGLLHKSENVDDLARQIERLITNSGLRAGMSLKSVEQAALFSAGRYRALIAELYKKLI